MPASDAASSHHTSPRSRPLTVAQSGPTGSELQKSASARKTFSGSQDEGRDCCCAATNRSPHPEEHARERACVSKDGHTHR